MGNCGWGRGICWGISPIAAKISPNGEVGLRQRLCYQALGQGWILFSWIKVAIFHSGAPTGTLRSSSPLINYSQKIIKKLCSNLLFFFLYVTDERGAVKCYFWDLVGKGGTLPYGHPLRTKFA